MNDHHRFMRSQLLDHIEELERRIQTFEARIEAFSAPFAEALVRREGHPLVFLFCTDTTLTAAEIVCAYCARFAIETGFGMQESDE